jgi:hypothetical protein
VRKWLNTLLLLVPLSLSAQDSLSVRERAPGQSTASPAPRSRKWLVGSGMALGYGGSFVFLNEAWYKNYKRSSFRTFNDSGEWMQVDKVGHAWSTYHTSRVNTALWRWAGVKPSVAVWLGSGTSMAYLLSIEYLDGRSAEWGWSWADVGANFFGAALFAGQELGWKEQRISLKFSSHRINYAPGLEQRANQLFGTSLPERLLKDYNAQTYWLSFNLSSLTGSSKLPSWLNLAIGYGAQGMYGGYENLARDASGAVTFDRRDIPRYRQIYLSPDIDLTRIRTRSRFLRSAFSVLNVLKIPAPALEFSKGGIKVKAIAF